MRKLCCLFLLASASSACFGGYDSRWGQSAAVQRQYAAEHAPTLRGDRPDDKDAKATPVKTMRVRAFVARAYATQVVDVSATLRELFADVNDVTEPSLGVKLELEGLRTWNLGKDDDLQKTLAELHQADPASDVEWVVGFVGALPRATQSFHDLGVGDLPGRYVVLRSPSSAMAHDAVERSYDKLSDEERHRVQKDARRHRAAAVFLHELGHTLGALHERSDHSLMYPEYRARMTAFSPDAVLVMRGVLGYRDYKNLEEQAALYRELAAATRRAPAAAFFDEVRQKFLTQADELVAKADARVRPASPAAAPEAAAIVADADPPELSPEDKARFARAREAVARKDWLAAWDGAKPLFSAYRDVLPVQELRCSVATMVFRFDVARRECERLMQLSTGKP
jgi:hypothetical protein